jgi:hypothetical protein
VDECHRLHTFVQKKSKNRKALKFVKKQGFCVNFFFGYVYSKKIADNFDDFIDVEVRDQDH